MADRKFSATSEYRYGFNGKEGSKEVNVSTITFELRIYDVRVGRFLSRDPRESSYGWQTPYAYYKNSPIKTLDILGAGGKDGGDDPPRKGLWQRLKGWVTSLWKSNENKSETEHETQEQEAFNSVVNNSVEKMAPLVEAVEEAKSVIQSFVPGADSYYEIKQGNYCMAAIYGVVDICGGSLEKGVVKSAEKLLAKEITEVALKSTGRNTKQLIESTATIKNSFSGGSYKMMEATEDMIVYRFSGGNSLPDRGDFFSLAAANNATEANKMLNIWRWGNTGEQITPTIIKKGTQFAFGGINEGWGFQVFIPMAQQAGSVIRKLEQTVTLPSGNLLPFTNFIK